MLHKNNKKINGINGIIAGLKNNKSIGNEILPLWRSFITFVSLLYQMKTCNLRRFLSFCYKMLLDGSILCNIVALLLSIWMIYGCDDSINI